MLDLIFDHSRAQPCQIQTQIYQSVYRQLASFARLPLLDGLVTSLMYTLGAFCSFYWN